MSGHPVRFVLLLILLCLALAACENGLAPETATGPPPKPYGIRGVIRFLHWPPADSVLDLRLAVLEHYPVASIVTEVIQGRAKYTDQIRYGIDSEQYSLSLAPLPTGSFPFVGVAQQYGSNIQQDWRVVGIYFAGNDSSKPGSVVVPVDSMVPNINITVDFAHPPVLP